MNKWWVFLFLGLVGCATPAVQTQALRHERPAVPEKFEIENVPFVSQSAGYCGPATLTMVMRWAGLDAQIDEVAQQVYTPGMKGSLQADMISAARRHGFTALTIDGFPALLKEVSAGHPVIVFENLALSWFPQWHYAVVFGYDLDQEKVLMHSGPEAFKRWDMSRFERSWMLGDYWGLVILPAGQLSATASELDHANAAAALENLNQVEAAESAYKAILAKWPQSLVALIGLGNIEYTKKNYKLAVAYLKKAVQAHPESQAAQNNLTVARDAERSSYDDE